MSTMTAEWMKKAVLMLIEECRNKELTWNPSNPQQCNKGICTVFHCKVCGICCFLHNYIKCMKCDLYSVLTTVRLLGMV